ncbi:hypothetical protein D3C80_2162310 [compost metagenome]
MEHIGVSTSSASPWTSSTGQLRSATASVPSPWVASATTVQTAPRLEAAAWIATAPPKEWPTKAT